MLDGTSLIVCLLGPSNRIRIPSSMTPVTIIIYTDERTLLIDDKLVGHTVTHNVHAHAHAHAHDEQSATGKRRLAAVMVV